MSDIPSGYVAPKCQCDSSDITGISDGSSIYAWRCNKCGVQWPKNRFVRQHYGIGQIIPRSPMTLPQEPQLRYISDDQLAALKRAQFLAGARAMQEAAATEAQKWESGLASSHAIRAIDPEKMG